jgi:hypothetical protein
MGCFLRQRHGAAGCGVTDRVQWETLATGVAALGAAWWTVKGIRDQIRDTRKLAEEQRQRRARAAVAMLPLALAELADYAKDCITGLFGLRQYFKDDGGRQDFMLSDWTPPKVPDGVLPAIRECIEFVDHAPADALGRLVRQLQVQHSRLVSGADTLKAHPGTEIVTWHSIRTLIKDAAETYALGALLLQFARGERIEQFDVTKMKIANALYATRRFEDLPELESIAEEWKPTL